MKVLRKLHMSVCLSSRQSLLVFFTVYYLYDFNRYDNERNCLTAKQLYKQVRSVCWSVSRSQVTFFRKFYDIKIIIVEYLPKFYWLIVKPLWSKLFQFFFCFLHQRPTGSGDRPLSIFGIFSTWLKNCLPTVLFLPHSEEIFLLPSSSVYWPASTPTALTQPQPGGQFHF